MNKKTIEIIEQLATNELKKYNYTKYLIVKDLLIDVIIFYINYFNMSDSEYAIKNIAKNVVYYYCEHTKNRLHDSEYMLYNVLLFESNFVNEKRGSITDLFINSIEKNEPELKQLKLEEKILDFIYYYIDYIFTKYVKGFNKLNKEKYDNNR